MRRPINIGERLALGVADAKALCGLVNVPRRREAAAFWHERQSYLGGEDFDLRP